MDHHTVGSMNARRFTQLGLLLWLLLVPGITQGLVRDYSAPAALIPPERTFWLGPELSSATGRPLAPLALVAPDGAGYVCAELATHEVLVVTPSASSPDVYRRVSLSESGTISMAAPPDTSGRGHDAFLRLPGDPEIVCRRTSPGETPFRMGLVSSPEGSYIWELYQEALKRWARDAVENPTRPPAPPTGEPSSLPDRLWFLALWLKSAQLPGADAKQAEAFLRRAAMWETLRIRPLNLYAFTLRDISPELSDDCMPIPDEESRTFCRRSEPIDYAVTGPAVLHVTLRPEVRLKPTPILEEHNLYVVLDGELVHGDPIPTYPDHEPYPDEEWVINPPPLLSTDGALLGKRTVVRLLIPPGAHRVNLRLADQPAWWAITLATPMVHLEDAANRSERLEMLPLGEGDTPFERFLAAEDAYRLGNCRPLADQMDALFGYRSDASTVQAQIARFRVTSCAPGGERVAPADLETAFRTLGQSLPENSLLWEDRSGEGFRREQIEAARASYLRQVPGWLLRENVSGGAVNQALAGAMRQLWYLDSLWMDLMPLDAEELGETWVFQQRARYPELEALPGGVSLVEVHGEDLTADSRLVEGVTREVMLISAGSDQPDETAAMVNGLPFLLVNEAPVQVHSILTGSSVTLRKLSQQGRSLWVQMRLPERDEVAEAKFVRVWDADAPLRFALPAGGYQGYVMVQLFPPADAPAQDLSLVLESGDTRHVLKARYDGPVGVYPLADRRGEAVAHPLGFSLDVGRTELPISLRLDAADTRGWRLRMLTRVARPTEESLFAADRYSAHPEPDPERVVRESAKVRALTLALADSRAAQERAMLYLDRAEILCALNYGSLAREDIVRAAEILTDDGLLQQRILSLAEQVDVGVCRRTPPAPLEAPVPTAALLPQDLARDADLLHRMRDFQKARIDQDDALALERCEALIRDYPDYPGCLSWWGEEMGRRVAAGGVIEPERLPLLIQFLNLAERVRWAGHDRWLPLLLRLTYWQPILSAEQSMGTRTLEQTDLADLLGDNPAYFQVAFALAAREDDHPTTRLLLPGSTLAAALPAQGPVAVRADLRCHLLTPGASTLPGLCRFALRIGGVTVAGQSLSDGQSGILEGHIDMAGSHLLELSHLPGPEPHSPVGVAMLLIDRPLPGIPVHPCKGAYALHPVLRSNLWVATPARPVGFHILGPAMLKIQSHAPDGSPAPVDVRLQDRDGRDVAHRKNELPGRTDIWLSEAVAAWVTVTPRSGAGENLVRAFYRELSVSPLAALAAADADEQTLAGGFSPAARELDLAEQYEVEPPSRVGLGSLLLGFRRLLRDETGRINPVDHYFLSQLGYTRRIEPLTLWFATDVEGRFRLDGNPSGVLSGRMVWVTPDPSLLALELRNSLAVQEVQTGTAIGNLVSLSLSRRFELAPTWSLTPDISAYYKWQALDRWREELVPGYMDASVYSPYLRDHPFSVLPSLVLGWQPWISTGFFAALEAMPNSDFRMLDYARFRIGDRMAFGNFQMLMFYDIQTRFTDEHRDEFYLRHQLHAAAQYSFWPLAVLRIAPTASYSFYPHNLGHGAFVGLLFELSPRRGLRDHAPGDEIFPWQVDPHRQWVRQWQ